MKQYRNYFSFKNKKIFSIDVFDTLLFRNYESEYFRFYKISEIIKKTFNIKENVESICIARIEAARLSYFTFSGETSKEPDLYYIYKTWFIILGYDFTMEIYFKLLDIELDYESSTLLPNLELIDFLSNRNKDALCIAISDMYLKSDDINSLIKKIAPTLNIDFIYSSSDHNKSKRHGELYDYVLDELALDKKDVIHCGDNYHSDFLMARKHGIDSIYTPRSKIWKIKNKISHYSMEKKLGLIFK